MKHIKLLEEFDINESKQGVLYHFLFFETLMNDTTAHWKNPNPQLLLVVDKEYKSACISSLVRKYDFLWANTRLTLDAEKLSHRFKISPISYFGRMKGNRDKTVNDQYEERILSTKPAFLDIKKYCLHVEICTSLNYGDAVEDEDVEEARKYFQNLGIPSSVIQHEDDWQKYNNKLAA